MFVRALCDIITYVFHTICNKATVFNFFIFIIVGKVAQGSTAKECHYVGLPIVASLRSLSRCVPPTGCWQASGWRGWRSLQAGGVRYRVESCSCSSFHTRTLITVNIVDKVSFGGDSASPLRKDCYCRSDGGRGREGERKEIRDRPPTWELSAERGI